MASKKEIKNKKSKNKQKKHVKKMVELLFNPMFREHAEQVNEPESKVTFGNTRGDIISIEFVDENEGLTGKFNPNNPNDARCLRVNLNINGDEFSALTKIWADSNGKHQRLSLLDLIFRSYVEHVENSGMPVENFIEHLSYVDSDWSGEIVPFQHGDGFNEHITPERFNHLENAINQLFSGESESSNALNQLFSGEGQSKQEKANSSKIPDSSKLRYFIGKIHEINGEYEYDHFFRFAVTEKMSPEAYIQKYADNFYGKANTQVIDGQCWVNGKLLISSTHGYQVSEEVYHAMTMI